jgi:preprotein translocase subunit SecD
LSLPGTGNTTVLDQAMNSAKDVIDRRINALGTLEPTIIRQGADRIVVQVPGLAGSAGAEGIDRQDREAGIQAGR